MVKVLHLSTFYFLRYAHVKFVKSLFTNIPETIEYVKNEPAFKEIYKQISWANNSLLLT